ncbi:hypothetical protein [Colwellia psychrerythraea]|uniref:Uncharacterized protein n=1 Tax=Colwellia psychrerythraea (strain 34H / ATCC BAA-681) TaxID=167879 RepID=Q483L5_COLP3|nr:hypothetical protein [Colwellia psychrerythraea]AAZ23996.1 hypothetical protein CPS_2021 [Colwellia psychrerythraea 34H]
MDKWGSILSTWNRVCVPELKLEPYNAKTVFDKGVWFDLKNNKKQMNFNSGPIDETVCSLLSLKGLEQEFMIAFKLLCFVKMYDSPAATKTHEIVTKVLSKKGVPIVGEWRRNARCVLPIAFHGWDYGVLAPYRLNEIRDVAVLVEQAAKLWSGLANTLSLLDPPLLLTDNTDVNVSLSNTRNGQCPLRCYFPAL